MDITTLDSKVAPLPSTAPPFPKSAVEAALWNELIEGAKAEASIRGIALPTAAAEIAKVALHVDSLVAVSILCTVEPIIGFELPESVVRAGGYISVESALAHLIPRIEKEWMKKKGAKP